MKKTISFFSALALIALVTLTSCEKKAEGDALRVVGQWKISTIVVNDLSMTIDEFKSYIDQLPFPSEDQKQQAKKMADMNYTLNDNYKFSGFLPDRSGVFGNYSGDWSFDSASGNALMVDKNAGLQWEFGLYTDGTMRKSVSATAMTITYIFKK